MQKHASLKKAYADTDNQAQALPSGCQKWGCKADGCKLVACIAGLCTFHGEIADFQSRWQFVTNIINTQEFRTMLKATRHVMRYGDCGEERKEQAATLLRNAYRAGLALGISKEILTPKQKENETERLEPMARRYFVAMHRFVKDAAMSQNLRDVREVNLEALAAKKSFDNATDQNQF